MWILYFFKDYRNILCLFVCMYESRGLKRASRSHGAGVTRSCEPSNMGAGICTLVPCRVCKCSQPLNQCSSPNNVRFQNGLQQLTHSINSLFIFISPAAHLFQVGYYSKAGFTLHAAFSFYTSIYTAKNSCQVRGATLETPSNS